MQIRKKAGQVHAAPSPRPAYPDLTMDPSGEMSCPVIEAELPPLGTAAESLDRLRPLVQISHIAESIRFTHDEWQNQHPAVLSRIEKAFDGSQVIVRSTALCEDTWSELSTGANQRVLDVRVRDTRRLVESIERVFSSNNEQRGDDQALVQEMLRNVTMSGVVTTRTHDLTAPYYVINYSVATGRTDTANPAETTNVHTLFLHRGMVLRPGLPNDLYRLMSVVQEIEQLVGHDALDIEFAFTGDGVAHVLQVRPIDIAHPDRFVADEQVSDGIRGAIRFYRELQRRRPNLLGSSTQLSVMTDLNPAETVGTKPSRLALSLYRNLITDETWARQRAEYGYRDVRPCNLLVDVLGHPYVDVRATFNSFIPATVSEDLAGRLVEHYLDHLNCNPELHDKVESDVLFTCMTFDYETKADRLRQARFSEEDIRRLRASLIGVTRTGIARCERDWAVLANSERRFEAIRSSHLPTLEKAFCWLEDARLHSALAFAHLAHGGFVATSLLRSLVASGAISPQQKAAFLAGIPTISARLQQDAAQVTRGSLVWEAFVAKYAHLRANTYDITSLNYAAISEEYLRPMVAGSQQGAAPADQPFAWDDRTRAVLSNELERLSLGVDVDGFDRFCKRAIEGRESAEFVFTRNLSAAIEALADFGACHFISREQMAHIRIQDLYALRGASGDNINRRLEQLASEGREQAALTQAVCLPGQIRSELDMVCFE